jgi:pyruvate ferredoxin oxidoreductase gamma subunit
VTLLHKTIYNLIVTGLKKTAVIFSRNIFYIEGVTMLEIRWHGRGGQGAVTSVEMLAQAAIGEGKYAQGFPSFGPERRGAPVAAFNRIDDKQIKVRSAVVVLDSSLVGLVNVTEGLKPDGTLIVNTPKSPEELKKELNFKGRAATVDASKIAWEELGVPITNTTMLGALIKVLDIVKLDSAKEPIEHRFGRIAQKNLAALKRAYEDVKIN